MLEAALWGLIGAMALIIGALLTFWFKPSQRVIGMILAFGAGTLISAVAYELVEKSAALDLPGASAIGLVLGALAFYVGNGLVARRAAKKNKAQGGDQHGQENPFALLVGSLLDGVPESFMMGASLLLPGGLSIAFLVAVLVSNLPEGMGGTEAALKAGVSKRRIMGIWLVLAAILAASAAAGYALTSLFALQGALVQAFAAGVLLVLVADTMLPEAHAKGGKAAGLLVVFGFALAFALN